MGQPPLQAVQFPLQADLFPDQALHVAFQVPDGLAGCVQLRLEPGLFICHHFFRMRPWPKLVVFVALNWRKND